MEEVAGSVVWRDGSRPDNLCAVMTPRGMGCLALGDISGESPVVQAVLFFSDLEISPDTDLVAPSGPEQVSLITGRDKSLQNPHMTEKGVGVLGGVTPGSLASHYAVGSTVELRVIPVGHLNEIFVDPEVSVFEGLRAHWQKWREAERGDSAASGGEKAGTGGVLDARAQKLGGCACAIMPLSPVNKMWQFMPLVPRERARRGHVLANGRAVPRLEPLESLGTAQIPEPPSIEIVVFKGIQYSSTLGTVGTMQNHKSAVV